MDWIRENELNILAEKLPYSGFSIVICEDGSWSSDISRGGNGQDFRLYKWGGNGYVPQRSKKERGE